MEQVFDAGKSSANLLLLNVEKEETFQGHLLVAFIAAVVVKRLQDNLRDTKYSPVDAWTSLRNQKCKVFDNVIIPGETVKKSRDLYKLIDIGYPKEISRLPTDFCCVVMKSEREL